MNFSSRFQTRTLRSRRAFTLIELLAVITIIGVLASLTVGVSSLVSRKSKEARTRAELAKLELAIRNYHSKLGFYPPDNLRNPLLLEVDPVINQLHYELSGAVFDISTGEYLVGSVDESISRTNYMAIFGNNNLAGIFNSSPVKANVRNFLAGSKSGRTEHISDSPHVDVLVAPVSWPRDHWKANAADINNFDPRFLAPIPGSTVNPWRYVSSNPTNNPGEFDLWAELIIGNEFVVIGNWEEK